jgi:hypothetical protein
VNIIRSKGHINRQDPLTILDNATVQSEFFCGFFELDLCSKFEKWVEFCDEF